MLRVGVEADALTIPATAVMPGQKGPLVYVITTPALTNIAHFITLIRTYEQTAVIADGIKEGDLVVVEGQQRLAPGAKVSITKP